jgi:hypothetical protein
MSQRNVEGGSLARLDSDRCECETNFHGRKDPPSSRAA